MIVLIGSLAVNHHAISYRAAKDIDFVASPSEINRLDWLGLKENSTKGYYRGYYQGESGDTKVEVDAMDTESNKILMNMSNHDSYKVIAGIVVAVPRISTLAAIKLSHIRSDVHCFKTFSDYKFFREILKDNPMTAEDLLLLEARTYETMERVKERQKRINLNVKNDSFFKNSQAIRKIEHDDVHRLVAFNDIPVFEMVKRDLSKAKIDKDLFITLDEETKRQMVIEESMVIGYERFSERNKNSKKVYERGLTYFSTNLCKGWFQDYIFDNLDYFIDYTPPIDFVNLVDNHVKNLNKET